MLHNIKRFNNYFKIKTMATVSKKAKLSNSKTSEDTQPSTTLEELVKKLQMQRENTASSVIDYSFNKKRVKIISGEQLVPEYCEGVVYWMSRDCRVQDNWAFLFAQKLALKNQVPLHVCFCLVSKYLDTTLRHSDFLIKGNLLIFFMY